MKLHELKPAEGATQSKKRVISKIEKDGLKVLGRGEPTKRLDVKAAKFSETAQKAIEAAGGTAEVV